MRIIFAGTPPFAAVALEALADAGHEIALVLTQPDRPAGRGMKNASSAVKLLAQKCGFDLLQPSSLKQPELHAQLDAIGADIMVVAAYGLILPFSVLNIPNLGCVNIHASLLPRWRGAAPIERAILAGDQETGITIMQMDRGLDTGPILLMRSIKIAKDDTAGILHEKLGRLGAVCILEALVLLQEGKVIASPQNDMAATYAPKLEKVEAEIDWRMDAENIDHAVRAFNPRPGMHSTVNGIFMKVWRASVDAGDAGGKPGEIVAIRPDGIVVACGKHALVLEIVQKSGGKKLSSAEFLLGHSLRQGDRFEGRE